MSPYMLSPGEIEARAAHLGMTMNAVYARAGINSSVFLRWRSGGDVLMRTYLKLCEATSPYGVRHEREARMSTDALDATQAQVEREARMSTREEAVPEEVSGVLAPPEPADVS